MNLASVLLARARSAPDAVALLGESGSVSYGELDARSARLAGVLLDRLAPGTRVGVVAPNGAAFVVAYVAALRAGMIAAPLDPSSPAIDLSRSLATVGAGLVVASEGNAAHRGLVDHDVVVLDTEGNLAGATGEEPGRPMVDVEVDAADPAVLLFTAGTAGAPKPAMLTHGSLAANLEQMQRHPGLALGPDDVGLGLLPFFHVFGLNVVLGLPLAAGASVSLVEQFHPAGTLARVHDDGVTVIAGVPAVFAAWLDLPEERAPRRAFVNVRLAVSGAAALPVEVAAGMHERFGVDVHEGYGLTEASPVVTTTAVGGPVRLGSIGPPLPGVEVRLVDADGNDVLDGDPGEILVRGPNVFAGYWDDPEATARVLDSDGWLHTGDIAVADDDGWLRSSTGPRTSSSCRASTCIRAKSKKRWSSIPTSPTSRSSERRSAHRRNGRRVRRAARRCVAHMVGAARASRAPARALQAAEPGRVRRRAAAQLRGQGAAARAAHARGARHRRRDGEAGVDHRDPRPRG